jgi:multidrug efflux pump subunit AcrB
LAYRFPPADRYPGIPDRRILYHVYLWFFYQYINPAGHSTGNGLVVDDGIVVTENIYKKVEAGMAIRKAAFEGSAEIFFAVVSTSVTLAAVFLPIVFLQGFTGRLFREFAVVVAGAVLISAFVSLSLTPMLNVKLIRKNKRNRSFMSEPSRSL